MNQEMNPLYGELVINTSNEDVSTVQEEAKAIHEQTLLKIREAAYFLAEKRGFAPGYEMEDWLQAKAQIEK